MTVATATYQNFIGGEWVDASGGETFEVRDPANGELLGVFPESTKDDVDRAVKAARAAYDKWRLMPAPHRGEILFKAAEIMIERKEDLAREMTREMGKVLAETRGDVQEAIDMLYYMGGEGRRLFGEVVPSELPDKMALSTRLPVGVVGAITPWNFPIAIPSWKLAPALICGNTVVFKPAEDTPILSLRLVEILLEAGLPKGVVNVVFGHGPVGAAVVEHPDVDLVTFTGSTATGKSITKGAAEDLKRVSLELGGKNVIIVHEDADLDLAVEGIVWSAFGTTGQRCTAASRIVVHEKVYDEVARRVVEGAEAMKLGHGLDEDVTLGPVVNQKQLDKISSYRAIGEADGATLLTGGERATEGDLADGFFYKPTVWGDVDPKSRLAQEEIFGPVTALIKVSSFEEAIAVANDTTYGLSSSIFTKDVNLAFRAMRDLYTGITYINAGTTGAEIQLPFGGTKGTGNGHRDAGTAALDVYTEWKALYIDFSGKIQKAQIDELKFDA
ncbi:MAG: aldehyde dehydrogenase family protein [Thermoleophilia bacterium]|nr:aldehyde dehydrogenase family protein [Thermoleophilia bacterium]